VISPELREYAETPDRFAPIPRDSSITRFDDGRICVIQGVNWVFERLQATPDTSYPILKRLGFEDVCTIKRLEEPPMI
jgi:hypothetical protein